jgi:hypothetical protein
MKIVFDGITCLNPTENFYLKCLSKLDCVTVSQAHDFSDFDIALFMQSPHTINRIHEAISNKPSLKIGVVDPRNSDVFDCLRLSHFLIVNSIEKADFFSAFQPNVHIYYDLPEIQECDKKHRRKDITVIGYHGNKTHLASIFPNITLALEELSRKYSIEFWAMYNIQKLGKCVSGMPKNLKVRHIQWSLENYHNELSRVDIGLVPTLTPIAFPKVIKKVCGYSKKYLGENSDDYLLRFKVPTNACRALVFGKLGIPVVADFSPSLSHIIDNGRNGFLANSVAGWYYAIEKLILSHELRQQLANNFRLDISAIIDVELQNIKLMNFFKSCLTQSTTPLAKLIKPRWTDSFRFRCNIFLERTQSKFSSLISRIRNK